MRSYAFTFFVILLFVFILISYAGRTSFFQTQNSKVVDSQRTEYPESSTINWGGCWGCWP
ncbi:hypothetical protein HanXRQr2_Chr01g0016311 [Helianthus annuus]|uniref:Uncharacterized protein n=1 Tax=Helianthus annuus TaxID=4232 RepID=A0A251VMF8_HELAN|nr:hypothetical protein HanXRQr2_Chr01g0016311 [Helianthus annuus]KAJ0622268.1 hypothetical protein HanIR_Chr01g0018061 [Helianthus annuus]KAJ0956509.1 hypothetical protein HanPSC8_Chr01g0015631 [Helianthus annuus]